MHAPLPPFPYPAWACALCSGICDPAGLGRTGLAIACFLLYTGAAAGAEQAVQEVRRGRPGALQTAQQVSFVSVFLQYVEFLRWVQGRGPWGWGGGRRGVPAGLAGPP